MVVGKLVGKLVVAERERERERYEMKTVCFLLPLAVCTIALSEGV